MMCSWRFLPAWAVKITWSTPASSYRRRYSRTWSGVPTAPRRPAVPSSTIFAPSRSSLTAAAATASGSKPCSVRRCSYSAHTSVTPGWCRPNT